MKIDSSSIEEVLNLERVDLIICALGYEERATQIATQVSGNARLRICIQLVDDCNTQQHKVFEDLGFEIVTRQNFSLSVFDSVDVVLIDYSVMMKSLYADIVGYLGSLSGNTMSKYYFMYTHAKYEPVRDNNERGSKVYISNFSPLLLTDTKISMRGLIDFKLLISLGSQRLTAINIIERLEAKYSDVVVFINKSDAFKGYYADNLKANKDLLRLVKDHNILELDFFNFNEVTTMLDSLLFRLSTKEVPTIVCPLSVKTFSLLSMIYSLKYDNVLFYNASSGSLRTSYKKEALPYSPVVYKLTTEGLGRSIVL